MAHCQNLVYAQIAAISRLYILLVEDKVRKFRFFPKLEIWATIVNCLLKQHPEPEKRSHKDEHSQQLFASKRSTCAQ